jgi:hypothetical protein
MLCLDFIGCHELQRSAERIATGQPQQAPAELVHHLHAAKIAHFPALPIET